MSSRAAGKQKKKKNSISSHPVTPNTSESSIPSVEKPGHGQENSVDEPLTGRDIESLLIKQDELVKLNYKKPPSPQQRETRRIVVKKPISADNLPSPNKKNVAVLRPLPAEVHVSATRILGSVRPGPRYTSTDELVPHSILGSVDDYTRAHSRSTATRHGDSSPMPSVFSRTPVIHMPATDSHQQQQQQQQQQHSQTPPSTQTNALLHWERIMGDRSQLQEKLARSVHTAPGFLTMHRGEHYRIKQEDRETIDRAIPAVENGKGFYTGSEFWRTQEKIGDDVTGIRATLTQTERGNPPDLEHITTSDMIKTEMNMPHLSPSVWGGSSYLQHRKQTLSLTLPSSLVEQSSFESHLQVAGQTLSSHAHPPRPQRSASLDSLGGEHYSSSDELNMDDASLENVLDGQPDVATLPLLGPALRIDDKLYTWEKVEEEEEGSRLHATGSLTRVLFEAGVDQLVSSYLCIENCGTTAIRYHWQHVLRDNPLGTKQAGTTQRFYFDTRTGVMQPGQQVLVQFMFKSSLAGVFMEHWRLQTEPALCGNRPLTIILRGVAFQEDLNREKRQAIDVMLGHRIAHSAASNVVDRVVSGVTTPPRTPSPDPVIKPEESVFYENNTGVYYHYNIVQQLKRLYVEILRPQPTEPPNSEVPEQPSKGGAKKNEEKDKKGGGGGKKKEEKKGKQPLRDDSIKDIPAEKEVFVFPPDLPPWDLSLLTLQQLAANIEDDSLREEKLRRLSTAVDALSLPPCNPLSLNKFTKSYMLLCAAVDQMTYTATHLRHIMGLPVREHSGIEESGSGGLDEPRPPSQPTSPAHAAGKKEKKGGKQKGDTKEKTTGKKEKDSAVPKKKSARSVAKTATPPESTVDVREQGAAPLAVVDTVMEAKYRDNLQAAVYQILGAAMETMAGLMELNG